MWLSPFGFLPAALNTLSGVPKWKAVSVLWTRVEIPNQQWFTLNFFLLFSFLPPHVISSFASKLVCLLVSPKHPGNWILVCLCLSLEISRRIREQKSTESPRELQAFPGKAINHGQGSVPCSCHRNIIIIIGILTSPAPGAAAGAELFPCSSPAITELWW